MDYDNEEEEDNYEKVVIYFYMLYIYNINIMNIYCIDCFKWREFDIRKPKYNVK